MAKNLIIWYSRRGENYWNGSIRDLARGNTEIVAEFIQNAVDAERFEVRTVATYPKDYYACTDVAKKELRENLRPELVESLETIEPYSDIFICGPCWWGTYPMAIFSQVERLDWNGKNIFPVMTHEGSGLGHCERDLKRICQGASIREGLAVHGAEAQQSARIVTEWAKRILE